MLTKTRDLKGSALDWAVAIAEGIPSEQLKLGPAIFRYLLDDEGNLDGRYRTGPDLLFSTKWEAGGPIIEKGRIKVFPNVGGTWSAQIRHEESHPLVEHKVLAGYTNAAGPTPLIAAMRCYVAAKLGDEVFIPAALLP